MNNFKDFDNCELKKLLYFAQKVKDLRYYHAIMAEIARRNDDEYKTA